MDFENTFVDPALLPRAERVELQPIEKAYFKVICYNSLIFWGITGIIAVLAVYLIDELKTAFTIAALAAGYLVLSCGSLFLYYLSFKNKGYAIRKHDILYQSGWFIKTLHVCPFNRIQHCKIDSGIFERRFGLSKLNIYTAGGDDSDIKIPGLTLERAEQLRELILERNISNDSE